MQKFDHEWFMRDVRAALPDMTLGQMGKRLGVHHWLLKKLDTGQRGVSVVVITNICNELGLDPRVYWIES